MRGLRAFAAASAAVTVMSGTALTTVLVSWNPHPHAATAPLSATDRFLQLSGGDDGAQTTAAARVQQAGAATSASTSDCKSDPATLGTMPNGWCIRPAGKDIEVLRFPLGLMPLANGTKMAVSSSGGGVQGLTVIDAASLQATPTSQANLFMGLASTPDGRVLASGGN